ncbi:MAG: hypothetical protein ABI867_17250 [Kofleriaceae bacterium]
MDAIRMVPAKALVALAAIAAVAIAGLTIRERPDHRIAHVVTAENQLITTKIIELEAQLLVYNIDAASAQTQAELTAAIRAKAATGVQAQRYRIAFAVPLPVATDRELERLDAIVTRSTEPAPRPPHPNQAEMEQQLEELRHVRRRLERLRATYSEAYRLERQHRLQSRP